MVFTEFISFDVANAMTLHREAAEQKKAASERRSALKSLKALGIAEEETQKRVAIPVQSAGALPPWGGRPCRAASFQMSTRD